MIFFDPLMSSYVNLVFLIVILYQQEDEIRLMRCVFVYVRSGQVAAAEELCVKAGHHWRAATLEGWKLHHDPNPLNPSQRNPISGNPYR